MHFRCVFDHLTGIVSGITFAHLLLKQNLCLNNPKTNKKLKKRCFLKEATIFSQEKIQKFAEHFAAAKLSANSEYEIEYEIEYENANENEIENEILVSK